MSRHHLLCVVNYPANSGYAWDYLERVAGELAVVGAPRDWVVSVAYPALLAAPVQLQGTPAHPVAVDFVARSLSAVRRQVAHLRSNRVTSLYFIEGSAFDWRYPLYRLAGVRRIVAHYHHTAGGGPPSGARRYLKLLRRWIPGWADAVVTVSDFVRERQLNVMLTPAEKVTRIWNGTRMPAPPAAGDRQRLRSELGIPETACLFVAVGRAAMEKGIDVIYRAFDDVAPGSNEPPWLVFVGAGVDFDALEQTRRNLGAASRIVATGYRSDVGRIMSAADVFVHAATYEEAFGLVVLEAMSRGLPCICSRSGGVPELVRHDAEGLLVPQHEVAPLRDAMTRLSLEPEVRARLGAAGQRRARTEFSWDRMITSLADVVLA